MTNYEKLLDITMKLTSEKEKLTQYVKDQIEVLTSAKEADSYYDGPHDYEISQARYAAKIDVYEEILSKLLGEI